MEHCDWCGTSEYQHNFECEVIDCSCEGAGTFCDKECHDKYLEANKSIQTRRIEMTEKRTGKDKLHALLAVEGDVKAAADQIMKETVGTFKNKPEHFLSKHSTYEVMEDGGRPLDPDGKEMVTTVDEKINYTQKSIIRALDATVQKEATNTKAKADLVVDGAVIAEGLPATALLHLEGKLKVIRSVYHSIPTLPPGKTWGRNEGDKPGVFQAEPESRVKTEKREWCEVVVPPTKEHPAQTRDRTKDEPIGKWTTIVRAGLWTPHKKSHALGRIDTLLRATKKARQRANDIEVEKVKIGKSLFDYING